MESLSCRLPGGYVDAAGVVHREAVLAPLTGREEELLASEAARGGGPALVTALLARCLRRLGTLPAVDEALARALAVADREFLLLRLRELTFGDEVRATVVCPWAGCRQKVDLDFSLRALPQPSWPPAGTVHAMTLSPEAALVDDDGTARREVRFRLPNGGDQEAVADASGLNEAEMLTVLLGRCLVDGGAGAVPPESASRLSPRARLEIERAMLSVGPRSDLRLDAGCPECEQPFSVPFDAQECFFGELHVDRERLLRETHYLAYHYHWSEREIMEMPRARRREYVDVLAGEIERLNDGAG